MADTPGVKTNTPPVASPTTGADVAKAFAPAIAKSLDPNIVGQNTGQIIDGVVSNLNAPKYNMYLGIGTQILGLVGVFAKGVLDSQANNLKFDAQLKGFTLGVKKMELDKVLAEIAVKMQDRAEETKGLAIKEAATVERLRIKETNRGKTERARIGARYSYMNKRFYNHGTPKFSFSKNW